MSGHHLIGAETAFKGMEMLSWLWYLSEQSAVSVSDCVILCSSFHWTKDGEEFDPGSDLELKVSKNSGSFAFYTLSNTMDTLKQYQGKYVCYASNELGTAVSNEAVLTMDGKKTHDWSLLKQPLMNYWNTMWPDFGRQLITRLFKFSYAQWVFMDLYHLTVTLREKSHPLK